MRATLYSSRRSGMEGDVRKTQETGWSHPEKMAMPQTLFIAFVVLIAVLIYTALGAAS